MKNIDARLSEHTRHSSILSLALTVSRQIRHFLTRVAHDSQQQTCPHGLKIVSRLLSEHKRHSSNGPEVVLTAESSGSSLLVPAFPGNSKSSVWRSL